MKESKFGFQPYLVCSCHNQIGLPLTIPSENAQHQTPWPKGWPTQTFRCPVCRKASAYSRERVFRRPVQTQADLELVRDSEVRRISAQCGEKACSGLVQFLFVAPKDSSTIENAHVAVSTIFVDIPCTVGKHIHKGLSNDIGLHRCETDALWGDLA
jgi:hypothetical protein